MTTQSTARGSRNSNNKNFHLYSHW